MCTLEAAPLSQTTYSVSCVHTRGNTTVPDGLLTLSHVHTRGNTTVPDGLLTLSHVHTRGSTTVPDGLLTLSHVCTLEATPLSQMDVKVDLGGGSPPLLT
jgi:hypothetical protein